MNPLLKLYGKLKRELSIYSIESEAGLNKNILVFIKRKYKIYKQHKRAYTIGYRAGLGKNMYLTFGSDKTVTKDAEDSYSRYAMAMKHYNQIVCDKDTFIQGYNDAKS